MSGVEAFTPKEIASLVETRGVAKANASTLSLFVLGVLAGAFIGLGAVLATIIGTGSELGFGPTRWLAGLGFSLGLILVVVAGAELFTGNNLLVMSLVSRKISVGQLLRNWAIVYVGNMVGALSIALMVWLAQWWTQSDDAVGATALTIAASKTSLAFGVVFVRGILANALVCLAVWLAAGGTNRSGQDRGHRAAHQRVRGRRFRTQRREHVLHPRGVADQGRARGCPCIRTDESGARPLEPWRVHQQSGRGDGGQRDRRRRAGRRRLLVRVPAKRTHMTLQPGQV